VDEQRSEQLSRSAAARRSRPAEQRREQLPSQAAPALSVSEQSESSPNLPSSSGRELRHQTPRPCTAELWKRKPLQKNSVRGGMTELF